MNTGLEILTLGGVRLKLGDTELTATLSSKATALLVYLACKKQPQSRLQLAELFWPERSEEQALSNLRTLLTRLRNHLDSYLTVSRNTISFNPTQPYYLDVDDLELGLSKVWQYFSKFSSVTTDLANRLEKVLKLYKGEFLAGFYLNEAAGFEEWANQTRGNLHQQVVQALNFLVTAKEKAADYEAANQWASRLLELDPFQEEFHRRRMLLMAQSGQRQAALNHYKTYQNFLGRELDIAPEAQTTDLYERIKKNEVLGAGQKAVQTPNLAAKSVGNALHPSDKIAQLKRVSLFAQTPEHLLAELAERLEEVRYKGGEIIFEKGELGQCMYIIAEGQVRVHDGGRTINNLSARDIFGEMAVLDSSPRLASVTTLTDTRLWRLEQATLFQLMTGEIEVVKGIIGTLTKRLRERVHDIVELDARLMALQDPKPH